MLVLCDFPYNRHCVSNLYVVWFNVQIIAGVLTSGWSRSTSLHKTVHRADLKFNFTPRVVNVLNDDLVEEILLLREQQEQTNMDEAAKAEHRDRIQALCSFINSQPRTSTKFDGTLVRKLLKDVKVCDVFIEFRFKSGTSVIIEK